MSEGKRKKTVGPPPVSHMVEDIVGCKWSLAVLEVIRKGIVRPGGIQRSIEGISTKVLNERLSKMLRYGILLKDSFPEIPPRVEYRLTPFGRNFVGVLEQIKRLQEQVNDDTNDSTGDPQDGGVHSRR